jgi:NAD(P)-dependent dehydrogenase (short-subunit alcohol dehydrogenase family)
MPGPDIFSLQDKTILLTGGSARIIKPTIQALGEAGGTVYVADLNLPSVQNTAKAISKKGVDVHPLQVDLSDEKSVLALRDVILARSGTIDVVVNAAVGRTMEAWDDDAETFRKSMEINAVGLFLITRAIGDVMEKQKSGSIINIASIHGVIGPDRTLYKGLGFDGFIPDYFFHKAGMINFTRFVASYYGASNVRCNCVSPGGIRSSTTSAKLARRYGRRTLLGRMGTPEDLVGVVRFLASDASLYLTGSNIIVDGGYTAL